ncbi:MAG: GNAT family N-acetyltransferase [Chloroflexi bacterium]|nr:GNAT family N-acetyltransferase [Chloroflexota bacterium]
MSAQIRMAAEADAEQMLAIYAPVVRETVISFEYEPPSLPEFRERIRTTLERMPWLVSDKDSEIAGYAYASPFRTREGYRWACELTIYVHRGYHRCGIGRALYTSLFRCLALQGYCVAVATITIPNTASIALHESMGMRRVGTYEKVGYKHGQWLDDGVWQIELQPMPAEPDPPVPWQQIAGSAQWREAISAGLAYLKL